MKSTLKLEEVGHVWIEDFRIQLIGFYLVVVFDSQPKARSWGVWISHQFKNWCVYL